jgi:hypothetical protein
MQGKGSAFCGAATSLEVRYTGKPVSGWGGLVAVMRYLEQRGIRQVLTRALPDGRTSPNQIPVVDMVLALFAAVLTGGRRFAHVERLRSDEVVQANPGRAAHALSHDSIKKQMVARRLCGFPHHNRALGCGVPGAERCDLDRAGRSNCAPSSR